MTAVEGNASVYQVNTVSRITGEYIYIYSKRKNSTPPIKKKITHILIVCYKYQQRSLQR